MTGIQEQKYKRAPHDEITSHLKKLLGDEAVQISQSVTDIATSGDYVGALAKLKAYDATLGGTGIFKSIGLGVKLPGIYRALSYVEFPFLPWKNAVDGTRGMVSAACVYLEELIKRLVRLWPWDVFRGVESEKLALGQLVTRLGKNIPADLREELAWLNSGVYVFAKHQYDLGDDEDAPEHYFELDEAVAVYLIARKLGLELEEVSKKPEKVFTRE
jgi:hypothetical protein